MNMDEVFEKAKDAVNIAAKKTEEVVNISKLKLETVKVNNEIKSLYEKLGRSVYQSRGKSGNSNEDTVHSLCEEIDELLSKPVSYTHLDVYKRQTYFNTLKVILYRYIVKFFYFKVITYDVLYFVF